ncbi:lactosylceramide 1,3-N-acetyl-beta-D-glucosaminyltransferase [Anopheles moucheti]|uniref:lactosylceramide 1,3-N-acetyl-beta-D-glucosaminyltransferase n=1 Tax=Anopheles moucheti TaxID=186751 RepID=UPI0022F12753|nr:lactosylceramide 1,3-N-acetyl-beta-D-glucosaminyltransferase [Anopheles moucheti]
MRKFQRFLTSVVAFAVLYGVYRYSFRTDSEGNYLFLLPGESGRSQSFIEQQAAASSEQEKTVDPSRLANLTGFEYVISNDICKENNTFSELLGVILITSYVGHDEIRSAHRQAISQQKLLSMGLLRIFSLGVIPPTERFIQQVAIAAEQRLHGDLIQGNFVEAYRNLTYKHLMSLQWATQHCRGAKYLLKMDDDIVFDPFYIQNYLSDLNQGVEQQAHLLAGYMFRNKKVIRLQANKWYVSRDEFAADVYPPYLSGWLYITNQKTARTLVAESQVGSFFWIDDTFITGVLAQRLQIPLTALNRWFSSNSEFLDCCIRDMKRYAYQCDYYVGPNGGNGKLIMEFIQELERCYDNACYQRPPGKSLTATCVAEYKQQINPDHGTAMISQMKLR